MTIDYSLYLVTDNTPAILGDQDFVQVVKAAVSGGMARHMQRQYIRLIVAFRCHYCSAQRQDQRDCRAHPSGEGAA